MTAAGGNAPAREHAVLVVWDTSADKIIGAGFLIAPDLALTCAHVVSNAVEDEPGVGTEVRLTLPLPGAQPGGHHEPVHAVVEYWEPREERDVAVLRLPAATSGGVPTAVVEAADVNDHRMVTFGFPRHLDDGVWHEGRLLRRQSKGWIQAQLADPTGHRIEEGFSGAPVWDEELDGAVGMVVQADRKNPTGYVLPIETVLDALPALRAEVSHWRSGRSEPHVAEVRWHHPSWWNQHVESGASTTYLPRAARPVWLLLVGVPWMVLWATWLVGSLAAGGDTVEIGFNILLFLLVCTLALPRQWRARLPGGLFAGVVVLNLLMAGALLASGFMTRVPQVPVVALLALVGVQIGAIVVGMLASLWLRSRELHRLLPGQEALRQRVFGSAGQARAVDPGPDSLREAGHKQHAQLASDQLFSGLLRIPAVRILHAPPAPDQAVRKIDHAIVAGRKVALVYSALWPPGYYTQAAGNELSISRNGTGFPVAFPGDHTHFIEQVAGWRARLPNVDIRAFLVVHPSPPGPVTVELPNYPGTVLLAEHVVEVLGAWLSTEANVVDRVVLGQLLG